MAEWGGSSRAHEVGRGIEMSAFGNYLAHNIKPWVICEERRDALSIRSVEHDGLR